MSLETHDREMIEAILERPLTERELQPIAAHDDFSQEQRDLIVWLSARQQVLSVLYVKAITGVSVAGAKELIDKLTYRSVPSQTPPWGRQPCMARWRFALSPREPAGQYLKDIIPILPPFARLQRAELETRQNWNPIKADAVGTVTLDRGQHARLVLDLLIVNGNANEAVEEGAGMVDLQADSDTSDLLLVLSVDIDIFARVTWQYRKNETLAALNAPRLANFISRLRDGLHARYLSSDGRLETDETGFR